MQASLFRTPVSFEDARAIKLLLAGGQVAQTTELTFDRDLNKYMLSVTYQARTTD